MAERRRRASIRLRVTAGAIVAVLTALIVGAVGIVVTLDRVLTSAVAIQLANELAALGEGLDAGTIQTGAVTERNTDLLVALHTTEGVIVNASAASNIPVPSASGPQELEVDGTPYVVVARQLRVGSLVLARSSVDIDDAVFAVSVLLAIAVPLATVVIGLITWIVVHRSLAPVERMRAQVEHVDSAALDRRLPSSGNGDELDRLAGTLNGMLERIERGTKARQRFVSDASHELRSPLATMRQFAELATSHPETTQPGELAQVVLEEGERMQGVVDGLLLLARLDEDDLVTVVDVDLDDLALAQVERLRARDRPVDGSAVRPARVEGSAMLLEHAVRNLVDNALRHAAERVALGTVARDGRALLWVDDDGAGVPEADRQRIFDRFVRLDEGRARDQGGSGLGLAIVREIAQLHRGDAWVETAPLGGARFVLELPAATGEAS